MGVASDGGAAGYREREKDVRRLRCDNESWGRIRIKIKITITIRIRRGDPVG